MDQAVDRTALFGIDPRSLAMFRIGVGLLLVVDTLSRVRDLHAFYTDDGILSRADLLDQYGFLLESAFAITLAAGDELWVGALFLLQALAGLALVFGWRSRAAALAGFVLLSGVQLRNLYIGAGYDALLRMYLLWAIFAPTGARWAVDARGRPTREAPHRDAGSLAAAGQVLILYAATGFAKHGVEAWRTGEALSLHLDAEFFTTRIGSWLGQYPAICEALTLGTLWGELLWPLVLLVPVKAGPVRTVGVLGMMVLTIGFWLGLDVDLFPFAGATGLVLFLPAWFWDRVQGPLLRLGERLRALLDRAPAGESPLGTRASIAVQLGALLLFLWVAVWNVGVGRDRGYTGPQIGSGIGEALFLQQAWFMFATPAQRTGWVRIHGRTVDGQLMDLFAWGGPVPEVEHPEAIAPTGSGRPDLPSSTFASNRWRLLLKRIVYQELESGALHYGRYVCREWNGAHEGGARLDTFEIRFFHRPVPSPDGRYTEEVVWQHGCFR